MKTIYIPKGETVRYESLYADRIVVDGCLRVEHGLDTKVISGKGIIHAGKVTGNTIRIGTLDACTVMCKRLLAERVDAPEVFASESVTVSCVLFACLVKTPKLTVAVCDVEELEAADVVKVPAKRWSLFGILLYTTLQSLWIALQAAMARGEAIDADYEPVQSAEEESAEQPEKTASAQEVGETAEPEPVDEELNRVINLFKLAREQGYTLRLVPGTPEENAPVFDFEQERIIRPAA